MRRGSAINTGIALKVLPPCGECKRRAVGCHSACIDYTAYKRRLKKTKADTMARNKGGIVTDDYRTEQRKRMERKMKK